MEYNKITLLWWPVLHFTQCTNEHLSRPIGLAGYALSHRNQCDTDY